MDTLKLDMDEIFSKIEMKVQRDNRQRTALHFAAEEGIPSSAMEILIREGADLTTRDKLGRSALNYISLVTRDEIARGRFGRTIPSDQLKKLKLLMDGNLRQKELNDAYFLHRIVVLKGEREDEDEYLLGLIETFIEVYGMDVNKSYEGDTPLKQAIESGNISAVKTLLKCNADVNISNRHGVSPLHTIKLTQDTSKAVEIAILLINTGADILAKDERGVSAIVTVLNRLPLSELQMLTESVDIVRHVKDKDFSIRPMLLCLLQEIIGEEDIKDRVLHSYAEDTFIGKLKLLCKSDCRLDQHDLHGRTLLHWSCWLKCHKLVTFLCKNLRQNELCKNDSLGRCSFHYAVSLPNWVTKRIDSTLYRDSCDAIVTTLKEGGMKINHQDHTGRSPLHVAVFEANIWAVQCLLKHGASVSVQDSDNMTPKDYATKLKLHKIHKIICEFGTEVKVVYTRPTDNLIEDQTWMCSDIQPHDIKEWIQKARIRYGCGDHLVKRLLRDTYTKPVSYSTAERKIIKDMDSFATKLSKKMTEIDLLFQSEVRLAGSLREGTKITTANEFDFQFSLTQFGQSNENLLCDIDGHIVYGNNNVPVSQYIKNNGQLNECSVYQRFFSIVLEALASENMFKDINLHILWERKAQRHFTAPLKLKWVGLGKEDTLIDIDLVPTIKVQKVSGSVRNQISHKVQQQMDLMGWTVVIVGTYARLSFHDIETKIMRSLMPDLQLAYMVAKGLLLLCPTITLYAHTRDLSSYLLKNCLFHELDPDHTYCLLDTQVLPWTKLTNMYPCVLKELDRQGRVAYIRHWARRLFDRLELFLKKSISPCYLAPSRNVRVVDSIMEMDEGSTLGLLCSICKALLDD